MAIRSGKSDFIPLAKSRTVFYMKRHMVIGRGKTNRTSSKGFCQRFKEDLISQLPDHLICHILSLLSTKEAVKTSVLSTRWRSLWLWLPSFELKSRDFSDFNTFMSFGNMFFDSNRVSCIHKLKLTIHKNDDGVKDAYYLTSWFDAAVKHKIQHLHVHSYSYGDRRFHKMPQRLYNCHTLVCLKLFQVTLDDAEFVFLPFLKTMHLEYIEFPNESTFETLVLCCPVLEDLKIVVANDDAKVFRVHSRSLRRLTFERVSSFLLDSAGVVIDTPRLCFLSINDNISKSFIVDNLESIAILDRSLVFGLEKVTNLDEFDDPVLGEFDEASVSSMRSSICSFLRGIWRVTDMRICARTFKLICQYSKLEPLPQFGYTSRLHMTICISSFKWLPTFLESFPNLKFLDLDVYVVNCEYAEDIEEVSFSSVPECLLSSLEFVEFIAPIQYFVEMKLVKYFLKNSAILKKLTLPLASYGRKDDIFKKLLKIPRGSTKCKVIIS